MQMTDSVLLIDKADGIATVTLNRPQSMNALSRELRAAIIDGFAELKSDGNIDVVILTGAGRAFCAGLDLKELGGESPESVGVGSAVSQTNVVAAVEGFDRPVIGAINGFAVTGGFELALACDVLIASTNARFADTHARVGILPGWGLSQKLSRAIGIYRAKELSLTGNYLSAAQAEAWGLANRVVAPAELLPTCQALARDMQSCVREVVRGYKQLIDRGHSLTMEEGLKLEQSASKEQARQVTPEQFAARRSAVQERGRRQKESG